MRQLRIIVLISLAVLIPWTLSYALQAFEVLQARDDPARIVDLKLRRQFNTGVAEQQIQTALEAGKPSLAHSFVELARQRDVKVDPALTEKVQAAVEAEASFGATALRFARGFVTGDPDDGASLAGTTVGDLLAYGDIRDAAREGTHLLRGEEVNRLLLTMSLAGIGVTAGTYASFGAGAPARAGLSIIKAGVKSERAGARLARVLRWERPAALIESAREIGTVQAKAGSRAALETLRLAEQPKDLGKFARVAATTGGGTWAVLTFLGRGAIVVIESIFSIGMAILGAVINIIWFCASLKGMVERTARTVMLRCKVRRLARRVAALEPGQPA
jgi:hypothetical protein